MSAGMNTDFGLALGAQAKYSGGYTWRWDW